MSTKQENLLDLKDWASKSKNYFLLNHVKNLEEKKLQLDRDLAFHSVFNFLFFSNLFLRRLLNALCESKLTKTKTGLKKGENRGSFGGNNVFEKWSS